VQRASAARQLLFRLWGLPSQDRKDQL
jgi:hypothetical protein